MATQQTYLLTERINDQPAKPIRGYPPRGYDSAQAWLWARAQYWKDEGYVLLAVKDSDTVTGYHAASGQRVVVELVPVAVPEMEGAQ